MLWLPVLIISTPFLRNHILSVILAWRLKILQCPWAFAAIAMEKKPVKFMETKQT